MTKKEITEIIAMYTIAWPNSEIAKSDHETLKLIVNLWTECAKDVHYFFGRKAILTLCRESKFPPSIAEFIGQAKKELSSAEWNQRYMWDLFKHNGADDCRALCGKEAERVELMERFEYFSDYWEAYISGSLDNEKTQEIGPSQKKELPA